MKIQTNEELLDEFENVVTELVKAANGWNRKSERKLSKSFDELRAEILHRMEDDKTRAGSE